MTFKQSPKFLIVVFVAMFIAIAASSQWLSGFRFDLTENGLYTLSDGTHNILGELEQPVTIDFYFSEKATTQLPALRTYAKRVEELLQEYSNIAGDNLTVNHIDPVPFSEAEDRAALAGLQGVPGVANDDEVYVGLVAKNAIVAEEEVAFVQRGKEAFCE